MVGDLEARLLAHGLHLGDYFAHEALLDELRGEVGVKHHGKVMLGNCHEAGVFLGGDQHVLGRQGYLGAVYVELVALAPIVGGYHRVSYALARQILIDLGQELAIAGAQGLELGLYPVAYEGGSVVNEFNFLYVQLVRYDGYIHIGKSFALHVHGGNGLAVLDICRVAGAAAQHHYIQHGGHVGLQLGVYEALVLLWPVAKVYALRGALIHRPYHILIHCLGHEGGEGGGYQRHGLEHGVEGHVGGLLVGGHILAPVPLAAYQLERSSMKSCISRPASVIFRSSRYAST